MRAPYALLIVLASGLTAPATAQDPSAPPVRLLQGPEAHAAEAGPWYKSNDPRQLWSRIEQLEAELVATRRQLADARKQAAEADKALRKAVADLARREQRIQRLEDQLEGRGGFWLRRPAAPAVPAPPTPVSAAEAAELDTLRLETARLKEELDESKAQLALAGEQAREALALRDGQVEALRRHIEQMEASLKALQAPPPEAPVPEAVELDIPPPVIELDEASPETPAPEAPAAEAIPAPAPETAPPPPAGESAAADTAQGNQLLQKGEFVQARKAFERALAKDAHSAEARLGLAAAEYGEGRTAEASAMLSVLLGEDPDHPQAIGLKGILAWKEGDAATAERLLKRAISLAPEDAQLYNYMAIVQHALNNIPQAILALKTAVRLDPVHPEAHFNLAVLMLSSPAPQLEEARAHYQKALELGSPRDEKIEAALKSKSRS